MALILLVCQLIYLTKKKRIVIIKTILITMNIKIKNLIKKELSNKSLLLQMLILKFLSSKEKTQTHQHFKCLRLSMLKISQRIKWKIELIKAMLEWLVAFRVIGSSHHLNKIILICQHQKKFKTVIKQVLRSRKGKNWWENK